MSQRYKINFPIGDWSGDGHGKCDWFIVESDKPVEEVREAHYLIKDTFGIDLEEEVASEYRDNRISADIVKKLGKLGFNIESIDEYEGNYSVCPSDMLDIWVFLLNKVNSELRLVYTPDNIPTISFYGRDEKNRQIGFVGYGCYE